MRVLFLFPYPFQEAPSQRFRFEQYLTLLQQNDIEVTMQSFWDLKTWKILYKPDHRAEKVTGFLRGIFNRLKILFTLSGYEAVFIHRECIPLGPPIMEWFISKIWRKRIIYDFDDAIWLPNTSTENKAISFLKFHSKVNSICRWSARISCGNKFLAAHAAQYNINAKVNPTTIDTENLHIPEVPVREKKADYITIGWTGTHSTIHYLNSVLRVIQVIEKKYPIRFLVISDKKPDLDINSLEFIQWNKTTEVEDLRKIDIGIMPLADDIWANGKCGLKALQYMALEIPSLVSPVGVNSEIIENGVNGFLCKTENDWLNCLEKLIDDHELRIQTGIAARQEVIRSYSVVSNSENFLDFFK